MEDQTQLDFEAGQELYERGLPYSYCESSDQEYGWLVAREQATGTPAQ